MKLTLEFDIPPRLLAWAALGLAAIVAAWG